MKIQIHFWVTQDQLKLIDAAARHCGLDRSSFLRNAPTLSYASNGNDNRSSVVWALAACWAHLATIREEIRVQDFTPTALRTTRARLDSVYGLLAQVLSKMT